MDYQALEETYWSAQAEIQKHIEAEDAMRLRMSIKNTEIQGLKAQIKNMQDRLSLQLHAIKEMQKPLMIDQSVNSHYIDYREIINQNKKELMGEESSSAEFMGKPVKPTKLQSKWYKYRDECLKNFETFSEGNVRDLYLSISLGALYNLELQVRLKESKELTGSLDQEIQASQGVLSTVNEQLRDALSLHQSLLDERGKLSSK
jgi:hypothetical protein